MAQRRQLAYAVYHHLIRVPQLKAALYHEGLD